MRTMHVIGRIVVSYWPDSERKPARESRQRPRDLIYLSAKARNGERIEYVARRARRLKIIATRDKFICRENKHARLIVPVRLARNRRRKKKERRRFSDEVTSSMEESSTG